MKKAMLNLLKIILASYIIICIVLYFFQEKLIFHPVKLDRNFAFTFPQKFQEITVMANDSTKLNGVLFTADSAKGLIFYLHGNAGSINEWGEVANTYTDLHYDVFLLDYRGYGKSEGSISGQEHFFNDVQAAYNEMKKRYNEDSIIVLGYSLGTGLATKLASANCPKMLILQAPYYSATDMMTHTFPIFPTFLLKYKFRTDQFIRDCKMPVVIFHGNRDEVIYYNSSVKLKTLLKPGDTLITLNGQGHNGITENPDYLSAIGTLLSK